jgi:malonyl-CoA O-methyltransferase
VTRHHGDLRALLAEVREVGASTVGGGGRPGLMGRAAWGRFESAYEGLRRDEGLPLTYEILFAYASK